MRMNRFLPALAALLIAGPAIAADHCPDCPPCPDCPKAKAIAQPPTGETRPLPLSPEEKARNRSDNKAGQGPDRPLPPEAEAAAKAAPAV